MKGNYFGPDEEDDEGYEEPIEDEE